MSTNINGIAKINPSEAMSKASNMKSLAQNIEDLLNKADKRMQEINDENTGLYHGKNKPSQLRSQLDEYKKGFYKFHEQIDIFADNIIKIAERMLQE